jgi:hypothetical protein
MENQHLRRQQTVAESYADKDNEKIMVKSALIPTAIIGVLALIVFSLVSGREGFFGALLAQFVVVIFFLVHLLVSKLSRNLDPMATMALALLSYVTKLTAIGTFLIVLTKLTPREAIDRTSFGVAAIAATAAWLGGEIKGYLSLKTHLPLPEPRKPDDEK